MKPLNVLITAASRRVPLVRAFQSALRAERAHGRVVATDVNPMSPAVHVADRWIQVPLSSDPSYIDTLLAICRTERIGLVVPTIDDELELFGEMRGRFEAQGVHVAVSPAATARVCNDKLETARALRQAGVDAAATYPAAALPDGLALPLFIKPRVGRGAVHAHAMHTPRDLAYFRESIPDAIVQEYLDGPEYSIDMLCDFDGRPLSIVPRRRAVVRAGVIDQGCTEQSPALLYLAQSIARVLRFHGPVNIQCRIVSRGPVVFEINPRFGGGIPLTIAAGADFPAMLLKLARGCRLMPEIGRFRDGLWMSNYEEPIFLERDAATGAATPVNPFLASLSRVA